MSSGPDSISGFLFPSNSKSKSARYPHTAAGYVEACDAGTQYCCDLAQYLRDNRFWVGSGLTNWIVKDMARISDKTAEKGYAVGFCAALERALYLVATRFDHYGFEQDVEARQAAAMRKLEYRQPRRKAKRAD